MENGHGKLMTFLVQGTLTNVKVVLNGVEYGPLNASA